MIINRRTFLKGAGLGAGAGLIATAGMGAVASPVAAAEPPTDGDSSAAVPFYGQHQAGILETPQAAGVFAVFNVTAKSKPELIDALKKVTTISAQMTQGETLPTIQPKLPPVDNNLLGPQPVADALTITVGVGESLFDKRYGLAAKKPNGLTTMPVFPNDNLQASFSNGDVYFQICAGQYDTAIRALRLIMRQCRGSLQLKYRIDGFMSQPRPVGSPRNLLGFMDGSANPSVATDQNMADDLIWVGDETGQPWATGGTFAVFRRIRMFVEFWDRIGIPEQEGLIGRQRNNGAPLNGTQESDLPNYGNDQAGIVTPLDSHIRLANPQTEEAKKTRILRRGYNYDVGIDANGNLDQGLIFVAFNRDTQKQFETIQNRLADEGLVDYIQPTGGGYFFILPGVKDSNDWLGSSLLT